MVGNFACFCCLSFFLKIYLNKKSCRNNTNSQTPMQSVNSFWFRSGIVLSRFWFNALLPSQQRWSVHLTILFSGQSWLSSYIQCPLHILTTRVREENGRRNYFMINSHESMWPDWDWTRDPGTLFTVLRDPVLVLLLLLLILCFIYFPLFVGVLCFVFVLLCIT